MWVGLKVDVMAASLADETAICLVEWMALMLVDWKDLWEKTKAARTATKRVLKLAKKLVDMKVVRSDSLVYWMAV